MSERVGISAWVWLLPACTGSAQIVALKQKTFASCQCLGAPPCASQPYRAPATSTRLEVFVCICAQLMREAMFALSEAIAKGAEVGGEGLY